MSFTYSPEIPSDIEKAIITTTDEKDFKISSDSIYSTDTGPTLIDEASFNAGTRLHIHSRGQNLIRLPLPSSELEIAITDASGVTLYVSTRQRRHSGNAILSHSKLGNLISTSYFVGPGRPPIIQMLQPVDFSLDTIKVSSGWTSRATSFTLPNGKTFEWFYNSKADAATRNEKHVNVLVLRQVDGSTVRLSKKEKSKSKVIAKLIRSDDTRTAGTSRTTAGNGGELLFNADAASYLDESVVVATCVMMLKKEVDRRRGLQFAMMAGAAGGGS